jgi:hypothetical protein
MPENPERQTRRPRRARPESAAGSPGGPRARAEAGAPPAAPPSIGPTPAGPPDTAAEIVAALWRADSPALDAGSRSLAALVPALAASLAGVAADAERLAGVGTAEGRAAARLLAETATVLRRALERPDAGAPGHPTPEPPPGGPSWPMRLRLGRLERWLAGRAATDPAAGPAGDLCLWVLEHLDAAAP